jgi:integrase
LARPSRIVKVTHHEALAWSEVPSFFAAVRANDSVIARAMELITLTACRKGEGLGAVWGEVDLAQQMWTIPRERMKDRRTRTRDHRIPLSTAALDLLDRMRRELGAEPLPTVPLFTWRGKRLNDGAPDKLLKKIGFFDKMTTHGLRSSHTDFAADNLNLPREVREMALAHKIGDDVELAYLRTDMFARRRALAEAWACWCQGRPIDPAVLIDGRQPDVVAVA